MSPIPHRLLGVPSAISAGPSEPPPDPTPPPPAPGAGVNTEYDVIMGSIANPYPTGGYSGSRAFVSAEGFGAAAWTRYRGGGAPVVFVTNRNVSGSGSLKAAVEDASGPRKVWPLVWGNVDSKTAITPSAGTYYTNVFRPSPGRGLALRNGITTIDSGAVGGFIIQTDDVVLRYLKSHAGAQPAQIAGLLGPNGVRWSTEYMNNLISRHKPSGGEPTRIMVDHCNFAFFADQSFGATGIDKGTLQHTWIFNGIDTHFHGKYFTSGTRHAMPILVGYQSGDMTMHHVFNSTGRERNPRINGLRPGTVFDGRCNMTYNTQKWGPLFMHANTYSGSRVNINWSKFYWQPGPWTTRSYWMLLSSSHDLPGFPYIWLDKITAPGFLSDASDPWSRGISYRKGGKSDHYKATPHSAPAIREEANSVAARDAILAYGADRYVIDPATGDMRDCRDAAVYRAEKHARDGTGRSTGMDIADINGPDGWDTTLPSGGITVASFFDDFYNPWATGKGYPTGQAGFNSVHSGTGLYYHDLYEAWLTPHFPAL